MARITTSTLARPDTLTFSLRPKPPFRLDLNAWALRRRPHNIVDRWDGRTYRRVLPMGDAPMEISVWQVGRAETPVLHVTLAGKSVPPEMKQLVRGHLQNMFALDLDLTPFYQIAARDPRLNMLVERFRGLRPPRFPTIFEALVSAFACQQLSLTVGIELLNRLTAACGIASKTGGELHYAFPRPCDLERLSLHRLRELGFSGNKGRAFHELSESLTTGRLALDCLESMDNQHAAEYLLQLRGVGRWTAEYVLLRGLRRLDVFPGDDVGARNKLAQWLHRPLDYAGVRRAISHWQPYSGLVYFHLLLDGLATAGELEAA